MHSISRWRTHLEPQAESIRLEGPMSETPEGYVVPAGQVQAAAAPAAALAAPAAIASAPMQVTDPYAVTTITTPASMPVTTMTGTAFP